jgi:hypothetical protein
MQFFNNDTLVIKSMRTGKLIRSILFLMLFASLSAQAQVSIQLIPPASSQPMMNDLFKFELINTGQERQVQIEATLTLSNSSLVYSAKYRVTGIRSGANMFSYSNLQLASESYGSVSQATTLKTSGLVAFGNYVICITVSDPSTTDVLSNNCVEQQFGPNSPPVLLSPDDNAEVETTTPLLSWLPPSPIQPNENVTYELKLAEIMAGQSPADALNRNPLLLDKSNISMNSFQYPVNAAPLAFDKQYAWQIIARNDNYNLGATEIWRFKIREENKQKKDSDEADNGTYSKLRPSLDGSYSIVPETLRFVYNNQYTPTDLKYKISDLNGKDLTPKDIVLHANSGENTFAIPLKKLSEFKSKNYYILEVYNAKNQRTVLMFKYFRSKKELK